MNRITIKNIYWRLAYIIHHYAEIAAIASYEVDVEETAQVKSWIGRYLDQCYMVLRWGSFGAHYYSQGIHLKGAWIWRDFLHYRDFREQRNAINLNNDKALHDINVLQDKVLFNEHFGRSGISIPETLLHVNDCCLSDVINELKERVIENIFDSNGLGLFFKPRKGINGKGNFIVRLSPDQNLGEDIKLDGDWLVQKVICQNKLLAQLHPCSVNTLRLITYRDTSDSIRVFFCFIRIGSQENVVDNTSLGGIAVPVNTITGELESFGLEFNGEFATRLTQHPTTGKIFSNVRIPYMEKNVRMVIEAHNSLPSLHTVGWDVAITDSGPLLVEGNDDWSGEGPMWFIPNFKNEFTKMLKGDVCIMS